MEAQTYTPRLKERYADTVADALTKRFGYANVMQVPRLVKISVNKGVGEASTNKKLLDDAVQEIRTVTGQQPSIRQARKSISNFKLRDGMPVGAAVTLRGVRMWEFLDRLVTLALPRVRDFRGVPDRSFDGRGNYTLGIKEQIIFPEIDIDKIDRVSGLDVTIVTTAKTDEEAYWLLKELGMPFVRREEEQTA
jgi:large subunit ribosomal protein L5